MVKNKTKDFEKLEELLNLLKTKTPTSENYIEGIGTVREYGKLNTESFVKRLLQSKYITG